MTQIATRLTVTETGELQDRLVHLGIEVSRGVTVADLFDTPSGAVGIIEFAHAPNVWRMDLDKTGTENINTLSSLSRE
jgi:hypothetical protein